MWTVLYAAMGYASYLVYEQGGFKKQGLPLGLYIAQLALNFAWTPLFFVVHRLDLATLDILGERPWSMIVRPLAVAEATFYPL